MSLRREWAGRLAISLAILVCLAAAGSSPGTAAARRIALGVYAPGLDTHPGRIDRYARLIGRHPLIVNYYKQWDFAPFVQRDLKAVWSRGAVPMVTWEPLSYHGRRYRLRGIARGRYDRYVRKAARAAASWKLPVFVRFAHEMNGDWYPWGAGVDGNTARRFKRAWRHVVRIFRRAGATNVSWVWTANVNQFGGLPFKRFYPGDRWVDWTALDGFNWGYGGSSYSFKQLFGRSYRVLAKISRRPIMIAETGTNDRGKARWIRRALGRQLPRLRRVKALVWFNQRVNGVDMRFDSSRRALRAFRAGARSKRYRASTREWLLGVGPRAGRR